MQVTTDGGKKWTNTIANVPNLPKNTWAYHVEPSNFDKNTCYVVFTGYTQNDQNTYAYKTSDMGKTWKSIVTPDIKGFARNIKEDLVNPNLLFLGTELGLYITVDGGQNWSQFTNNMPSAAVHYITIHPETNDLVMGSHGRGVIIIDDITPLRQITKENTEKAVYFFKTKPTLLRDGSIFAEGSDMSEYVGANPDRDAKIIYYLKGRHTFGKMTLEVLDKDGKVLADLAPGKSKGINIVEWNYNLKAPKMAKAKTFAFGGFTTPRLSEGIYKVRMTKGKDVFETEIELKADENSMHNATDRKVQFETAMKLYNMSEQLAHTVDQLDAMKDGAMDRLGKNAALKKVIEPLITQIDKMKESLVVLKGDNYVGSAEPQLREKVAELYAEVAGYYGSPSPAQMLKLADLEAKVNAAKTETEALKTKQLAEINAKLVAAKLEEIKLRSFEEFKAADK